MRSQKKLEKSQKARQNDLFASLAQKNFHREPPKKIIKKTTSFEQNIFAVGNFFSESAKINEYRVESPLNKKRKGILLTKKRIPVPMFSKHSNNNNNLCDLAVPQVIAIRRLYGEKPAYQNQLFNKELITNDIFCELFV